MKYNLYMAIHPDAPYMNKYIRTEAETEGGEAHVLLARDLVSDPLVRASTVTTAEGSFTIGKVTIREATQEEKRDFVEGHGIYNCYPYPEMKGSILKMIAGWNDQLTMDQIIGIILKESKDKCSHMSAVIQHFREEYEHRYNVRQLRQLCEILNFPACRELQAERPNSAFKAPE